MKQLRWINFESFLYAENDPALGEGATIAWFIRKQQAIYSEVSLHNSNLEMHSIIVSFIFLFLINLLKLEYLF